MLPDAAVLHCESIVHGTSVMPGDSVVRRDSDMQRMTIARARVGERFRRRQRSLNNPSTNPCTDVRNVFREASSRRCD